MAALHSLFTILLFLGLGLLVGRTSICSAERRLDLLVAGSLRLLLLCMGLKIGLLEIGAAGLAQIGILSLAYASITVAGTLLIIYLFRRLIFTDRRGKHDQLSEAGTRGARHLFSHLAEPMRLFFYVLLGGAAAAFLPGIERLPANLSTYLLYMLIFFIGMQMARSGLDFVAMIRRPEMLLLPLATAMGSVFLGSMAAPLFGLSFGEGAALSAGFGWYSLSGVIISDMGDPLLGSAGFLINLIRETIALFAIPFLGHLGHYGFAIGIGGATSMDVTLPLIERSCGDRYVPLSVAHGALLSLLVPFLVPIFFGLS